MKVEFYGKKGIVERVRKKIENDLKRLERYPIYKIYVFLKDSSPECLNCLYFPCREKCKVRK